MGAEPGRARPSQSVWKIIAWNRTADYHLRHAISFTCGITSSSRHSSPSHLSVSSCRDCNMPPPTVPSFQNMHYLASHILVFCFLFFSQHNPSLGLCQSHFLLKSVLSLLLARVSILCCCSHHRLLSLIASLSSLSCPLSPSPPLSPFLWVCVFPVSSSSVCLSPSVLPLSILTLLCSFLFISWHFSQVGRNSFFLLTSVSAFVQLPLPRVSFFPHSCFFFFFIFQTWANEY